MYVVQNNILPSNKQLLWKGANQHYHKTSPYQHRTQQESQGETFVNPLHAYIELHQGQKNHHVFYLLGNSSEGGISKLYQIGEVSPSHSRHLKNLRDTVQPRFHRTTAFLFSESIYSLQAIPQLYPQVSGKRTKNNTQLFKYGFGIWMLVISKRMQTF